MPERLAMDADRKFQDRVGAAHLDVVDNVVTGHVPDVLLRSKDGAAERRGLVCSVVNCIQEEIMKSTSVYLLIDGIRARRQMTLRK
jgi:hypothetical protein